MLEAVFIWDFSHSTNKVIILFCIIKEKMEKVLLFYEKITFTCLPYFLLAPPCLHFPLADVQSQA